MNIRSLTGWKRRALLLGLGASAALTLAPFYIFPLIIPAYGLLFVLVNGALTRRQAFSDGWWWGWGFHIAGLYWFCMALLTDPEKFGWAIPLALFGLTGIIALYHAFACAIYKSIKGNHPASAYLFALVWLLAEYARGHLFTGFPWNLAGYSFGFSDVSLQLASVLGAYGLTFFAVLLGVSIFSGKRLAFACWALFACSLAWGYARLEQTGGGEILARVRVVQANISVPHNWNPKRQFQSLESYMQLTQSPGLEHITHVIWPESAVPYFLEPQSTLAQRISNILPSGATLITGTMRTEPDGDDFRVYNSIVALDADGNITGSYDKRRLVPFGEFLPFRKFIPSSWNLPVGDKDFSRGASEQALNWHGVPPLRALSCYEVIFPELSQGSDRAEWLLSTTNDVWFGNSTGPRQHFQMARMRAVEQGLPFVRAANTGISAYIDEFGRIRRELKLGEKGVIDFLLQKSQLHDTTYKRIGDMLILLLINIGVIFIIRRPK